MRHIIGFKHAILTLALYLAFSTFSISATGQDDSTNLFLVSHNGKAGYMDRNGKLVIKASFDSASEFNEGRAVVSIK
jgi:hypothetical protein